MIYQDITRFLKRYLGKPSADYKWKTKDNLALFSFIQDRYSDEHIQNNAMETREAFRVFFEPIGNLLVRFSLEDGISYKLLPYHIKPSESKHLKTLEKIIKENRRAIEYPYNDKDDQIALLGKIRRKINAEIVETKERINKKELVRFAIKQALDLDEKDIVLTLKKCYIIKLFKKNSFLKTVQPSKDIELPTNEELSDDYCELFAEISISDFLEQVMSELFADKLNFQKISNNYYEQNILVLIKEKIAENLKIYLSDNSLYINYLSEHILKLNIVKIHEFIAIEIFEQITNKDDNAKQFLNYYTGQVYIENGVKYTIPEITTEDGKRWNINSLMSTATVWLRSRSLSMKLKAQLSNIEQNITENIPYHNQLKSQLDSKKNEHSKLLKEFKAFSSQLEVIELKLKSESKGNMDNKSEKNLSKSISINRKILNNYRRNLNALRAEKSDLESAYNNQDIILLDYRQNKKKIVSQITALSQDLNLSSNAFHSILSSVVKALMKRKTKITE